TADGRQKFPSPSTGRSGKTTRPLRPPAERTNQTGSKDLDTAQYETPRMRSSVLRRGRGNEFRTAPAVCRAHARKSSRRGDTREYPAERRRLAEHNPEKPEKEGKKA